jgi:hypothetical protein
VLVWVLRSLLVVFKEVLEALGSLEGALVSYSSSGFDGFGHLSGFSELDGSFFDSYVVVDKWWLYYIIEYAGGETMEE